MLPCEHSNGNRGACRTRMVTRTMLEANRLHADWRARSGEYFLQPRTDGVPVYHFVGAKRAGPISDERGHDRHVRRTRVVVLPVVARLWRSLAPNPRVGIQWESRANAGRCHAGGPDAMMLFDKKRIALQLHAVMPELLRDFPGLTARYHVGFRHIPVDTPKLADGQIILEALEPVDLLQVKKMLAPSVAIDNISICARGHLGVGQWPRFPHEEYPLVARLPRGAITGRFLMRDDPRVSTIASEWLWPRLVDKFREDFAARGIYDYRLATCWEQGDGSYFMAPHAVFRTRDQDQWMLVKMRY